MVYTIRTANGNKYEADEFQVAEIKSGRAQFITLKGPKWSKAIGFAIPDKQRRVDVSVAQITSIAKGAPW